MQATAGKVLRKVILHTACSAACVGTVVPPSHSSTFLLLLWVSKSLEIWWWAGIRPAQGSCGTSSEHRPHGQDIECKQTAFATTSASAVWDIEMYMRNFFNVLSWAFQPKSHQLQMMNSNEVTVWMRTFAEVLLTLVGSLCPSK